MNPTEPPTKPDSPQSMPPTKDATSSSDWVEAVTGSHSLTSAPPGVRRVYELIGYYGVWLLRESLLHHKLILHWIAVSAGLAALAQHLWHVVK